MMTFCEVSFHCILVEVLYVRVDGGEHDSSSLLCARSEDWQLGSAFQLGLFLSHFGAVRVMPNGC